MKFIRNYLQDVLGLEHIKLRLPQESDGPPACLSGALILFLAEPKDRNLESLEIFQKMKQAIKLKSQESATWEKMPADLPLCERQIPEAMVVVSFSQKHSHYLATQRPDLVLIQTHHPQECLAAPHLKKRVWEDLKLAAHQAGISPRLQS